MVAFHRFLIGTAILFCIGFACWLLAGARRGPLDVALALAFAAAGVALGYYLRNLERFLNRGHRR